MSAHLMTGEIRSDKTTSLPEPIVWPTAMATACPRLRVAFNSVGAVAAVSASDFSSTVGTPISTFSLNKNCAYFYYANIV